MIGNCNLETIQPLCENHQTTNNKYKITEKKELHKTSNKKIIIGLCIIVIAYVILNIIVQSIYLNLDKLIDMIQYYSLTAFGLYIYHINIHPILDFLLIDEEQIINLI